MHCKLLHHHSDDVVETIIINDWRNWLAGQLARSTEHLARPLLDLQKDILEYAKDNNLQWVRTYKQGSKIPAK